jgi:hypothetical protein
MMHGNDARCLAAARWSLPTALADRAYCHRKGQAVRFKPRVIQEAPAGHNSGLGHAADQPVA